MFVKSSRPTYKRRVKKAQEGIKFATYTPVEVNQTDYRDLTSIDNPFNEFNFATTYDKPTALVVPETTETKNEVETQSEPVVVNNPTPPVVDKVTYTPKAYKGLSEFNKAYDEVEKSNPEAKRYRQFLTKMAEQESGFDSVIQNRAGAPAYGYFQFMQDDKKYNNIRQYAGTDVETFRSNPKLQIEAAIKLAKSFEKGFSKEDLELAKKNGYSTWGLLGGAWLAGNGGVRKFLQGKGNPSDRHWSKEGKGTDVATRIKVFNFEEGGVIKYQEPAQGVQRRDNTYVQLPIDRTPITRTDENGKPWNELSTMERARLNVRQGRNPVTSKPVARGNLEITSPEFDILAGVRGLPLGKVGEMAEQGLAKSGNRWARNRVIGRTISNSEIKTPTQSMPNNVGWGPRQTIKGAIHDKDTMEPLKLYSPKRYDAINEGAPKAGVWFQGKLGVPRTAANHSVPGKAEKAANARDLFAKRPVRVEGDLELNKPLVTVGDVPNRAQIQRAADTMGGDGVIFNDVYDNGYGRNQVVFSYRTDLKNGRMFKKDFNTLTSKKYPPYDMSVNYNPDRSLNMDKVHTDVAKGTKEAIDFLDSKIKSDTDLYNKELATRLGYEHFTPYSKGAERARVEVIPNYDKISYPNSDYAGGVTFNSDPAKDVLEYNTFYNLHPTSFHETLHRGYYGMVSQDRKPLSVPIWEHSNKVHDTIDFYDFKTKKLLIPKEKAADPTTYDYLLEKGEAAANTMELGKRLGLQPGQEYPGRKALEQMLKEFSESGNEHAFMPNYLNMKHPKRVWNALTGKYFMYPTAALIGGMNYEKSNNE